MLEPVDIARCPEHGLHGSRKHCFVCEKPVEQVPMVALAEYERLKEALTQIGCTPDALRLSGEAAHRIAREALRVDGPEQTPRRTHRVETYKPKPRPAGEAWQRIRDAVSREGIRNAGPRVRRTRDER
jgi:hypothetical protein